MFAKLDMGTMASTSMNQNFKICFKHLVGVTTATVQLAGRG